MAGAIVLVVGGVLAIRSDGGTGPGGTVPAGAEADSAALSTWYASSQNLRADIAARVASARTFLDNQDGTSLRPLCVRLGGDAIEAGGLAPAPDAEAQRLFASGAGHYEAAARSCGQLFDGTQIPAEQLQTQVRNALADGDREWAAVAARVGTPMATPVPSTTPSPQDATGPGASAVATRPGPDDTAG